MADDKNMADKAAGAMGSLEGKLEKTAGKLPGMSESNKKMFANFLPWGFGAFGLLCLFWAKDLWDVKKSLDAFGSFGEALGVDTGYSSGELWLGIIFLALVAVFVGMAFWRGFMKMTKSSWTFGFYAMCAAVIAGLVLEFFVSYSSRGWITLAVGLFGLYALFQVKSMYRN